MLVLTRRLGESITIDDDIKITVVQIKGKQVRIGIEAPKETTIHREEIYKSIQSNTGMPKHDATLNAGAHTGVEDWEHSENFGNT